MQTPDHLPRIELIFDADCPNVPQAREVLVRALEQLGLQCHWQEWLLGDKSCPAYARSYGSPTILVNGQDVSPSSHNDSCCCRIYPENKTFKGCPCVADIISALKRASVKS